MNEKKGLFREEVIVARQASWLGTISLARPASAWILTGMATAAAALILILLTFGSYARKSRVTGRLAPDSGLAAAMAPVDGTIVNLKVEEGDRVERGTVLAMIVRPRATSQARDTGKQIASLLKRQQRSLKALSGSKDNSVKAKRDGAKEQYLAAEQELVELQAQKSIRTQQQVLAEETLNRLQQLDAIHYVSAVQIQQQRSLVLEHAATIRAIGQEIQATKRSLSQIGQSFKEIEELWVENNEGTERELAEINQRLLENAERGELVLNAPVRGTVANRFAENGETVQALQPLITILPDNAKLEAHLLVPSNAIGFIEIGDIVLLRYRAYPYQKFGQHGGKVIRVSRSAADYGFGAQGPNEKKNVAYRVVVALDSQYVMAYGRKELLLPGMELEADIILERRKIYEWILDPIYTLAKRTSR